jgi:hypothetical protein
MTAKIPTFLRNAAILIVFCGCRQSTATFSGVVVTSKDVTVSVVNPHFSKSVDEGEQPLEGADVYLATDSEGEQAVPGCATKTDAAGLYTLVTEWPPIQGRDRGVWYLVVKKEGFTRCSWRHFSNKLGPDRNSDHVILGRNRK